MIVDESFEVTKTIYVGPLPVSAFLPQERQGLFKLLFLPCHDNNYDSLRWAKI